MKRTVLLAALLVAIACTMALSTPRPLYAILCCDNGGYTTTQHWVMKPTCSEATSVFRSEALPEAQDFCGCGTCVCAFSTPGCYSVVDEFGNTQWVVDGVASFGCKETCEIGPPPPI